MSKSWYGKLNRWPLLQLFATIRLLVQSAFGALHHINKIGQSLLLVHWDIPEVTTDSLSQLGLVQARSGLQLVVPFVASQRVHLKLEQVHLWNFHVMVRRLPSVVTSLPLPLVTDTLDEVFMEVAYVEMSNAFVDVQL